MSKFNFKNILSLFLGTNSSKLIYESNHTTPTHGHLTVLINGESYVVFHETTGLEHRISIRMISDFFQNGCACLVRFSSSFHDHKIGIILFNDIPQISRSHEFFSQPNPQMNFSVCLFDEKSIDIRVAKRTDNDAPNFALGCFKYLDLIKQFSQTVNSSQEYRIQVLWEMFFHSLRKIGYFDIFDINHFQSIVLLGFLKMFNCVNESYVLRNLFCSFVWRFLSNNCWFMIIGDKYRPIRGRPSRELIKLFSGQSGSPLIVNFLDHEFDCIGVITPNQRCALVSLLTTEVVEIGLLSYHDEMNNVEELPDCFGRISNELFPPPSDDDIDADFPVLLRRRPAGVDMSSIPHGVLRACHGHFVLFVFKFGNSIKIFIKRPDGTFECFCPYFFFSLNMFGVDNILFQLTNQFTDFSYIEPNKLVEALVLDCGFEPIFDGSATLEQFSEFLFESDFGFILRQLMCDFERFPERLHEDCSNEDDKDYKHKTTGLLSSSLFARKDVEEREKQKRIESKYRSHIESLQENQFVCDLKRVFEFIFRQFGKREDLGQEIRQILEFLDRLVKFLTVPPHSE